MNMKTLKVACSKTLFDLSDTNEVDDMDIRAILGKLLEQLNLVPVKTMYFRDGDVESVSYDLEPATIEE